MKSVGEVMAIGRTFEEVVQKAIRMCDIGRDGLVANANPPPAPTPEENERIEQSLIHPNDEIIFSVVEAINRHEHRVHLPIVGNRPVVPGQDKEYCQHGSKTA